MNENITVVFSSSKKIGSRILELFLFSKFSHTAIIVDGVAYEAKFFGGVQTTPKEKFIEANERYSELFDIQVTPEQKKMIVTFNKSQLGKKYDLFGVFAFPFRKSSWQDPNKWFCSEYNAASLVRSGVINIKQKFHRISPRDLWILISNRTKR